MVTEVGGYGSSCCLVHPIDTIDGYIGARANQISGFWSRVALKLRLRRLDCWGEIFPLEHSIGALGKAKAFCLRDEKINEGKFIITYSRKTS